MAINKNILNQNNQYYQANPKIKRQWSALKINETHQTSGELGKLTPIYERELIPGEKIKLSQSIAIQTQPTVTNLMHEIHGETMFFAVPNRLMHENWEEFITGGKNGETEEPNVFIEWEDLPQLSDKDFQQEMKGTLWDYFGYPMPQNTYRLGPGNGIPFNLLNKENYDKIKPNAFRHIGYNLIYNLVLRYPDIDDEVSLKNNEVLTGYWQSDYFTRARIYQQRGVPPTIPANVNIEETLKHTLYTSNQSTVDGQGKIDLTGDGSKLTGPAAGQEYSNNQGILTKAPSGQNNTRIGINDHILEIRDQGVTINLNDVITGLAILRYQVNNARIQPRYVDQLRVRFGVYPEDARLQRPEYLGSYNYNIGMSTVTNTADDQGHISGQGWAGDGGEITYEAKEHCWIFGITIARPATVYEGGLSKMDRRITRFDYPTPELANIPDVPIQGHNIAWGLGIQPVNGAEWPPQPGYQEETFGYQDVYEENRTSINKVTGLMRPSVEQNLATFNLARYFTNENLPNLNKKFLKCEPDVDRIKTYRNQPFMTSIFVRTEIATALPLPVQSEPAELQAM